jgi:hypothetical protein
MSLIRSLVLFCSLTAVPSWATVLLQLAAPNQSAQPGQTLTFAGTITNNYAQIVDLNSININLAGLFTIDSGPFFDITAPLSVAAAPANTGVYTWFTVTVADPYTDPFGLVNGTVTLLGGLQGPNGYDPSVQDVLATVPFSVNVTAPLPNPSNDIPEPATASLVLLFLVPTALLRLRKCRATAGSSRHA